MAPDPYPYALSLDQVDGLGTHAHRILLHAHLLVSVLEGCWTEGDLLNEGMSELATAMITDATAIQALVEQSRWTHA